MSKENNNIRVDEFVVEEIAKGSFIDVVVDKSYIVESRVVRLNYIALDEWHSSSTHNDRDCFETWEQFQEHKAERDALRKLFESNIAKKLGLDIEKAVPIITQSHCEIFSVVQIWEVK